MAHSANLISTDDLARQFGAPALRVFDCTTYLKPGPDGRYIAESGRANYDKGHIPGAAYLDLQADLSDKTSKLRFTLPSLEDLTKAFAAKGVGHGTFVVLYSHASPVWASRIWWMLRAIGFDDAAILDGGLAKWKAEGRPLAQGKEVLRHRHFTVWQDDNNVRTKANVLANTIEIPFIVAGSAKCGEGFEVKHVRRVAAIQGTRFDGVLTAALRAAAMQAAVRAMDLSVMSASRDGNEALASARVKTGSVREGPQAQLLLADGPGSPLRRT